MKKRIRYALMACIMLLFCSLLGGCSKASDRETEKNNMLDVTEPGEELQGEITERSKDVVVWTIPDGIKEDEIKDNIALLNEKLAEDGYPFSLQIQIFSSKSYREELIPLLKNGGTDIASLGMDYTDGSAGFGQDMVRGGYFEELSDYLASEKGQKLKAGYCDSEWKIVETDGGIYSLPNQYGMKTGGYMAFNRDYVTEEMLEDFSGSIQDMESLLEQINIPEGVYPVMGHFMAKTLAAMCGAYEEQGVFFDLKTGAVENPYQNVAFCQCLRELNGLYKKGYLNIYKTDKQEEEVTNGNFVVWLGWRYDDFYEKMKDTVITVPLPVVMPNALSCTNGISKNAKNKEAALELLTLLYTEEEYANLLLYGKEGEDYQVVDGYVCDTEGKDIGVFRKSLMLGIYDPLLPCRGDDMVTNRRAVKETLYESEYCLDSVILGFKTDYSNFDTAMYEVDSVTEKYISIWATEDFDAALQEAITAFEEAGGNRVVEELDKQVKMWMELSGDKEK